MAAELGYKYLELECRDDFLLEYYFARANADSIREFKQSLLGAKVELVSMLVMC